MKWAAATLATMLYLVWPYYSLVSLAQAVRSGDAAAINRMVDWDLVRTSVKSQIQASLHDKPKTAAERENPAIAAFGNAFALNIVNSMIDAMLTPEGIAHLIQGARSTQSSEVTVAPKAETTSQPNLYQRVKFAFFVSPVHFRLDLRDPNPSEREPALTVMMTFKGTGWQVSDVRVPSLHSTPKVAMN